MVLYVVRRKPGHRRLRAQLHECQQMPSEIIVKLLTVESKRRHEQTFRWMRNRSFQRNRRQYEASNDRCNAGQKNYESKEVADLSNECQAVEKMWRC